MEEDEGDEEGNIFEPSLLLFLTEMNDDDNNDGPKVTSISILIEPPYLQSYRLQLKNNETRQKDNNNNKATTLLPG